MFVVLCDSDRVLIQNLVRQSPNYFGEPHKVEQTVDLILKMMEDPNQFFLGLVRKGQLACMLGQRFSKASPVWIESFVFVGKQGRRNLYDLSKSGFLDLLDFALQRAEETGRYTFLTAFRSDQVRARLLATKRALRKSLGNRLHSYQPSLYHEQHGSSHAFVDTSYLYGNNKERCTTLLWSRPYLLRSV